MKTNDVKGLDTDAIPNWSNDDPTTSLEEMFRDYVDRKAGEAVAWYFQKRKRKRRSGVTIRLLAIAAAGFAVLVPMLSTLIEDDDNNPVISAGWAGVALLVGAGLIWIDRFLGATSGWLRYIDTGLRLSALRDDARLRWTALAMSRDSSPTTKQMMHALEFIRVENRRIHDEIARETGEWMEEFRNSLASIDAVVKARLKESRLDDDDDDRTTTVPSAGMVLFASNAERVEWAVTGNGTEITTSDNPAVLRELAAGTYQVSAKGHVKDATSPGEGSANQTIEIEYGQIYELKLKLERQ